MQGQYQPRAPGIAAGQSARTTVGTYFDYQGVLRTAQPRELRPNFVYQNGIWVQDGWVREGAATNFVPNANSPTLSGAVSTSSTIAPDGSIGNYIYNLGSSSWPPTFITFIANAPASAKYLSFFAKPVSGNLTLSANGSWTNAGPSSTHFDGGFSGPSLKTALQNGWSYWVREIPLDNATNGNIAFSYAGADEATIWGIWGVQLTDTPVSSPILTTGTPSTRAAD